MANNLSSRITALEQLKGASLAPLFVYTYDDVPMPPEQSAAIAEAKAAGRRVITFHNAPYFNLPEKAESAEAWAAEVAQEVAEMAEETEKDA